MCGMFSSIAYGIPAKFSYDINGLTFGQQCISFYYLQQTQTQFVCRFVCFLVDYHSTVYNELHDGWCFCDYFVTPIRDVQHENILMWKLLLFALEGYEDSGTTQKRPAKMSTKHCKDVLDTFLL